ncbi:MULTISPECIES: acyltransferase family protein [unclassified Nostoc]|uniref:acyltransferase family protein n=1 Tax=unclassified Nostoc TaxID=2593658 RepID=UPI000B95C2E5|nr:acyltransferase family protein [Nostoc sp. 'Peltigera membranacea cyanobiont' 232]OYE06327.1 hypothetical protein CDG79_03100 [Nostoc sp. 'Peltigera membranacea cyanobiont' 232]
MRNVYLELIRGIAALVVFTGHLTLYIDGFREALGNVTMLVNWGTEAVIVFFILSGAVIRLSMDANPKSRLQFIKHRIARIIPLYIIAIILTIIVSFAARNVPSVSVIVGNLLFLQTLQGYIYPTMWANMPLWSLSFEIFFYLAYTLTIGRYQNKLLYIWVITSVVAVIIQSLLPLTGIFGHFTIIFAYSSIWLLGYYSTDISKYVKVDLILAYAWLGLLPMTARLHFSDEYFLAVKHFIVGCTIIPLFTFLISHRKIVIDTKQGIRLKWLLWIMVYTIVTLFSFRTQSLLISKILYALLPILMIATICLYTKYLQSIQINKNFCLLIGQISYALYIIHTPIIHAVNLLSFNLGTKLILAIIIPVIFAYIFEFYFHPPLARKILTYGRTNSFYKSKKSSIKDCVKNGLDD